MKLIDGNTEIEVSHIFMETGKNFYEVSEFNGALNVKVLKGEFCLNPKHAGNVPLQIVGMEEEFSNVQSPVI